MADCIVKVPKYSVYNDYDFIGFSFNGFHCVEDLHILRVSDGSRYQENLTPQIAEQIGSHAGMDGAYFLGAWHRQKTFDIKFAFERLSQFDIYRLQAIFSGEAMGELWFDEHPYKVWDAKVTGTPKLDMIPFDDSAEGIIYKGEGTIQFTAYYPYAHTPDFVRWPDDTDEGEQWKNRDGRLFSSYYDVDTKQGFKNAPQWGAAANLWEELYGAAEDEAELDLHGEAPAWFGGEFKYYNDIGDLFTFTIDNDYDENDKPANPVFVIDLKEQFNMVKQIDLTLWGQSVKSMNTYTNTTWTLFGNENKKQWSNGDSGTVSGDSFSIRREEDEDSIKYITTNVAKADYSHQIILEVTDIYGNVKTFSYEGEVNEDKIQAENTKHSPITIANEEKTLFSFIVTKEEPSEAENKIYSFDSKTGLVVKKDSSIKSAIYYEGRVFGQLEPDIYELNGIKREQIKYRFWYY